MSAPCPKPTAERPRRVLVLGCGGAGKSTFTVALAQRLGVPVIHLDRHFWNPGWVQTVPEVWAKTVPTLLTGPAWVVDGNYLDTLDLRLAACDTAIFLDRTRWACLWRVVCRWWQYRRRVRPDLPENCPETLNWGFLWWIWRYPATVRPGVLAHLAAAASNRRVHVFRSDAETSAYLEAVR